jgi:hypothetical protein
MPSCGYLLKIVTEQLLGYEPPLKDGSKPCVRLTEHPNGLARLVALIPGQQRRNSRPPKSAMSLGQTNVEMRPPKLCRTTFYFPSVNTSSLNSDLLNKSACQKTEVLPAFLGGQVLKHVGLTPPVRPPSPRAHRAS